MKIYTKTGDKGYTSLFSGERVTKNHLRVNTYGTLDEMNSVLGLARAYNQDAEIEALCRRLQTLVFILNSDLATPFPTAAAADRVTRISAAHVRYVEQQIDLLTGRLPELAQFILPGGTPVAACLHVARTVCRRAERIMVELAAAEDLGPHTPVLVNRLSDYLFTLARYANLRAGRADDILDRDFPDLSADESVPGAEGASA
ncbi:MAG: cob(I)yrinic acid a,c-diamide adenosyltransferase [Acidobacteria bacterium]|nr:cob(I)yrinic acid a,c-diamide adenosyltransferase [Acidobacteriota bacterium]